MIDFNDWMYWLFVQTLLLKLLTFTFEYQIYLFIMNFHISLTHLITTLTVIYSINHYCHVDTQVIILP
jgi:hypothetical protein